MKKNFTLLVSLLLFMPLAQSAFCYEYRTDAYFITGTKAQSLTNSDTVAVSNNTLRVRYRERDYERKIQSSPAHTVVTHDPLIDLLTSMAFEEAAADINKNGYFVAGAKWPSAWTRDMSYAIDLSLGFLFPEATEKSLETRIEDGIILQDTGSGGSYPVSSDRIVWGKAAYSYALWKQDSAYFKYVYDVLSKTLHQDYEVIYDNNKNLFRGETSFLDWREQTYPRWMDATYIGSSYALNTNILFYSVLNNMIELAVRCNKQDEAAEWRDKAEKLLTGITTYFWIDDKNYFGSYYIDQPLSSLYEGYETLGESLAVIAGIAPEGTAADVLNAVKPGAWGMPVVAPQLSGIKAYHNDAVWPFVQGYRCLALKKAASYNSCEKEFASMIYTSALFRTFRENYRSSDGDMNGTELSSDRQLWSVGSWLSMVYRLICGIDFTPEGLALNPLVFDSLNKGISLEGFMFAGNTLNLTIIGTGDKIESCTVNGSQVKGNVVLPYKNRTTYNVRISMKKSAATAPAQEPLFDSCSVTPYIPSPVVTIEGNETSCTWNQKNEDGFDITCNGLLYSHSSENELTASAGKTVDVYTIRSPSGILPVLPSVPVRTESIKNTRFIEAESSKAKGGTIVKTESTREKLSANLDATLPNGTGYVQNWGNEEGDSLTFTYNAQKEGEYFIDFRYNNSLGPINTGDKCAIRAVLVDGILIRRIPLPQLGSKTRWTFSEPLRIYLSKGKHSISLVCDSSCYSQHHRINEVSVDLLRVSAREYF